MVAKLKKDIILCHLKSSPLPYSLFPAALFMVSYPQQYRPILHVLFGAFLISFSAVFVKIAEVTPTSAGFYRVFFGFLFLLMATLWRKDFKPINRRQAFLIIFCGFIFALDLFVWHESIVYIGPGLATLLGNFQVFLLTAVGIIFFKEEIRPSFLLAIPLAIFGLLLIVGFEWDELSRNYKIGVYFGLLTAICYTLFLLTLRKIQGSSSHNLFLYLMLVSLACSFFLGAKMLWVGDTFSIPNGKSLLALLALGFFSQCFGWVLIANAIPKIPASLTGLVLLLQPTLSFCWDVLFFNRATDTYNWLGLSLTLTAIYMGLSSKNKQQ